MTCRHLPYASRERRERRLITPGANNGPSRFIFDGSSSEGRAASPRCLPFSMRFYSRRVVSMIQSNFSCL